MPGFITIEGIEGSGKSTLVSKLSQLFSRTENEIVVTFEPGATALGKNIREMLLSHSDSPPDPISELLLFLSDRAQHVSEIIRPALDRGALVICDRYVHSTLAYQGYGRGINLDTIRTLNQIATGGLQPDLVIVLDVQPEVGLKRVKDRDVSSLSENNSWSRFEEEELAFHNRVQKGFLELAKQEKHLIEVVDSTADLDTLLEGALSVIRKRGLLK